MVVKNLTVTPARVAKVKNFTFREGERSCVVIDGKGMPLYYPNLYLTTQVRNSSRSSSTLTNSAGHLCAFLQAMDEAGVDLLARMSAGYVLEPFEVEALRGTFQRRLLDQPEKKHGISFFSSRAPVSKEVMHARVGVTTKYLDWLAKQYLRAPRDPDELARILQALKELRPINKKRNTVKRKRGLSDVGVAAVIELLRPGSRLNIWEDPATQVRNRLLFSVMYELGIRRGELLNLKIEDLDFGANQLSVMRRADEKDDPRPDQPLVKTNDRLLPVKTVLMNELRRYITDYRRHVPGAKRHGFVFVTHKSGPTQGQPLSIVNYKNIVNSLREAVPPLADFSGHDLRHYWNERFSRLMETAGVSEPEEELMRSQLMGWKFGSGSAKHYIQRYVEKKASEHSLKMQEENMKIPEFKS
ncbi:site-specific integrase [Pseudomonas mosselii]|uniref:tyrosine-type recombinase/integrase n=1 Tax=Pseudomonas TaxID=286 RepID=UPI001F242CE8|nr:site-specific integrase [Pseudomonas mosselii]